MATIANDQNVEVKVIREFYFKPEDAAKTQRPKKYTVGERIMMTGLEYRLHSSTNRVSLPADYDERVKKYQKPRQEATKGK